MSTIMIDTDSNSPCICRIVEVGGTRDILVETDWDYPAFAAVFGWDIRTVQPRGTDYEDDSGTPAARCDHRGTDGTITCPDCGCTAGDFIASAADFLSDSDGATADDPGYFD